MKTLKCTYDKSWCDNTKDLTHKDDIIVDLWRDRMSISFISSHTGMKESEVRKAMRRMCLID